MCTPKTYLENNTEFEKDFLKNWIKCSFKKPYFTVMRTYTTVDPSLLAGVDHPRRCNFLLRPPMDSRRYKRGSRRRHIVSTRPLNRSSWSAHRHCLLGAASSSTSRLLSWRALMMLTALSLPSSSLDGQWKVGHSSF